MRMSFGVNCHSMDKPTKVITRKTVVIQGFTTPGHLNKAGNLFILPVNYHQGMILKRGRVIGYYSRRSKDITGFLEYKAEILNLPFFKNDNVPKISTKTEYKNLTPKVTPKIMALMEGVIKLKAPITAEAKVGKNWSSLHA